MDLYCEYFEPDENGDICHAGQEDACPNYAECTASVDLHGNPLLTEESGVDVETRGFY